MTTPKRTDRVTLGSSLFMGVLMSIGSIGIISGIVLVFKWINDGFVEALILFGAVTLYGCIVLLLLPVFGLVVSIFSKSWYALKAWTAATIVSVALNVSIGSAALYCGSKLKNTDVKV